MKIQFFITIVSLCCLTFSCCKKKNTIVNAKKDKSKSEKLKITTQKEPDTLVYKSKDFSLTMIGLQKEDISINLVNDSLIIKNQSYPITNAFKINESKNNILYIKITYGVNQYVIDDIPAYPLSFVYEDTINFKKDSSNHLIDLNNLIKNQKTLKNIFEGEDCFNNIRNESYNAQSDFYLKTIIANENKYKSCCPEYVGQANTFLKRDKSSFKTIQDMSLEPTYTKITLALEGNKWLIYYN